MRRLRISVASARSGINHAMVFILTFLAYAVLHATRKAFGNMKSTILERWTPTLFNASYPNIYPDSLWRGTTLFATTDEATTFLGSLDCTFMITYSIGLYLSGWVGDRLDPLYVLSFSMCGAGVVMFFFGVVSEWLHFYNKYYYGLLWALNGLLQSAAWPAAVAIVLNWFDNSHGLIFGIWATCANFGNILGDLVVSTIINYGYHYVFLISCFLLLIVTILLLTGITSSPETFKKHTPVVCSTTDSPSSEDSAPLLTEPDITTRISECVESSSALSIKQVLLLPGVILYSLSYGFLKMVNYAFFFWLPYYLTSSFGWSTSDASKISAWFDVGAIVGGLVCGVISDLSLTCISRHCTNVFFLAVSIPMLFAYMHTPADPLWLNSVVMGVIGLCLGGPTVLISTVVGADLSHLPEARGHRMMATVTGIIDGTGSAGAALGQLLVPVLNNHFGWSSVFYLFIIAMVLTLVCVVPMWIRGIIRRRQAN